MRLPVACTERDALPTQASLELEEGDALAVYLLPENPPYRRTILRRADDLAPADAELLFVADPGEVARHRVLRVARVGRVGVEVQRGDIRARVVVGTELRSGARLEVDADGGEPVRLGLSFAAATAQGLRATVGGGGTQASAASTAQATLLWVVPRAIQVIRDPLDDLKDGLFARVRDSGISPQTFSAVVALMFTTVGTGAFGLTQYFNAQAAQAEAADLKAEAAASQAGKAEALAGEAACLVDRRALASEAGNRNAERRAAVEAALVRGPARTVAAERGGRRYQDEAVARWDAEAWEDDVRAVLLQLDDAAESVAATKPCRASAAALPDDVPRYVLTGHPDPTLVCPDAYDAVLGVAALRGRWGLSERSRDALASTAALSPDDPVLQVEGFDPRDMDRLALGMIASGVRATREALLSFHDVARPVLAPSEANLWAYALFDATNRMRQPAPGAEATDGPSCVVELIEARVTAETSASPAEPVLPPVAQVADGRVQLAPTPTAACPWTEDAVAEGARAALRAAARLAAVPAGEP